MQTLNAAQIFASRATPGTLASLFSAGFESAPLPTPAERQAKRRKMFEESLLQGFSRILHSYTTAMQRCGIKGWMKSVCTFIRATTQGAGRSPALQKLTASPEGLCGAVRDVSVETLLEAYLCGLYPATDIGPLCWWSPAVRAVAEPEQLVRNYLHNNDVSATIVFDRDFDEAVCARKAYIGPRMKWAFAKLFDAGAAHSFEVHSPEGERIGHGFGIAASGVFVIETMEWRDAASERPGLATLAQALHERRFSLIDAKSFSPGLEHTGFAAMTRADYSNRLMTSATVTRRIVWKAPGLLAA